MNGLTQTITATLAAIVTPELVGAVALTLAATHMVKVLAEAWLPAAAKTAARWRAFCATTSVLIGTLAGVAAWIGTAAPWYIVPAVAVGSGPAWRLAQAVLPARVRRAFLTATDRRLRGNRND